MHLVGNTWAGVDATRHRWARGLVGAAVLAVALFASAAKADPLENDEVALALQTFLSGAVSQSSPVASNPQVVDVYYRSPTEMTVFFVARNRQGRVVPGTVRAVYTASERWLWTSGNFTSGGMGGYGFRNPTHFGGRYQPVQ
jgi:opacity protein-like surface antigen